MRLFAWTVIGLCAAITISIGIYLYLNDEK